MSAMRFELVGAGKGDKERIQSKKQYSENYEKIFGKREYFDFQKGRKYCVGAMVRGDTAFFIPDTSEKFNHGLGCVTSGIRDAEKKAKAIGLTPLGNERIDPDKIMTQKKEEREKRIERIFEEGRKAMRVGRTMNGVPLEIALKRR